MIQISEKLYFLVILVVPVLQLYVNLQKYTEHAEFSQVVEYFGSGL